MKSFGHAHSLFTVNTYKHTQHAAEFPQILPFSYTCFIFTKKTTTCRDSSPPLIPIPQITFSF